MDQPVTVGNHRIVRLLGSGGMGAVYEAVDATSGQRVAIKLVSMAIAQDSVMMTRFEREAYAVMNIDTPHIARTLGAGRDPATGQPFAVMELLEGEDGRQLLKRCRRLSPDLALRAAAQICMGLERAHERRIIHRDIKPANIFFAKAPGGERVIKLVDFGIAKLQRDPETDEAETHGLTTTGSLLGSPLYMSPEQARGHKNLDYRSDLWSVGVVLYHMLTGRTPISPSAPIGDLIIALCTEEPTPIEALAPWVAPELVGIVRRAMQVNPGDRFQSASEMLAAIRLLLPSGCAITEEMLRPLTEAEQRVTAPIAPVSGPSIPGAARPSFTGAPAQSAPGEMPSHIGSVAQGHLTFDTPSTLSAYGAPASDPRAPQAASARPKDRRPLMVIGAALALAVGGVAAYTLLHSEPQAPQEASAAVLSSSEPRRPPVKLAIGPAEAEVTLDGASVTPKDGVVEIEGALGSVHKVRVRAKGAEREVDIVVTESGALPPKIDVTSPEISAAQTPTAAPTRSAKESNAGAKKPKPTATTRDIFTTR